MKFKKIIYLFLLLPLFSFTMHKYYLSLTQIEYKTDSKTVQIITNVFIDDIETAINKDYSVDLQLTTEKELKNNDAYFNKYLEAHLSFKIDNAFKKFKYLGKEYDGDLVYFYLEIEGIEKVNSIEIFNDILVAYFSEQQNLVKSNVHKNHKSKMFDKDDKNGIIKY